MQFINHRKIFYTISSTLIVLSIAAFFFFPKNFGIDMTGGLQIEYTTPTMPSEEKLAAVKKEIVDTYTYE